MSQVLINNGQDIQVATAATQDANTASPVRDRPAALLARLAGANADKPAFDPARMHSQSILPRLAEGLAQRPLGNSAAARAAAEALELVENLQDRPVTNQDLARFDALRVNAWKNDPTGEAGRYCDTLGRVLLLRPLTANLGGIPSPEGQALLADSLHKQLERMLEARTPQQFEQVRGELAAMRELFRQQGMLGPEQAKTFDRMEQMLLYRQGHAATLDVLTQETDAAENGGQTGRPLVRVLADTEAVRDHADVDSTAAAPPLGGLAVCSLRPEAAKLASRLYQLTKDQANTLQAQVNDLVARARSSSEDLEAVQHDADRLRAEIEKKANSLVEHDLLVLKDACQRLDGAIATSRQVERAAIALAQAPANAGELEAIREDMGSMGEATLEDEDTIRLAAAMDSLHRKSGELRQAARLEQTSFVAEMERQLAAATTGQEQTRLAQSIDARLHWLETLPASHDLAPQDRAGIIVQLKDMAQTCLVAEYGNMLGRARSTRLDAPSVAECAELLASASERNGVDSTAIRANLQDISQKALTSLTSRIEGYRQNMDSMGIEELRSLPFSQMAEEARRYLLPEDATSFGQALEALGTQVKDALYQKIVGPELQAGGAFAGLSPERQASLKELCQQGGCQPALLAALKASATDKTLDARLDAATRLFAARASGQTGQPEDVAQLDSLFLPHPELDDVAQTLLGGEGQRPDYSFVHARDCRDLQAMMEEAFPASLRKKLGVSDTVKVDKALLEGLVQQAAAAHGSKKRQLGKLDLSLVQALWHASKAQMPELSFDDFRKGLPKAFAEMPFLQNYLEAGIGGRASLKSLGKSIVNVSDGLGGKKQLLRFLAQIYASDPKWAAATALDGMFRSQGVKSIRQMNNAYAGTLADDTVLPREAVASNAIQGIQDLRLARAAQEDASRSVQADPLRCDMAQRLGIDPAVNPDTGEGSTIHKGATLAAGVLLAEKILQDTGTSNEAKQKLLNCLHFNGKINLDGQKFESGKSWSNRAGDTLGNEFRSLLENLRGADLPAEKENFEKALAEMRAFYDRYGLAGRAEAVLYFKEFKGVEKSLANASSTAESDTALKKAQDGKDKQRAQLFELDAVLTKYEGEFRDQIRGIVGTAQRQNFGMAAAHQDQISKRAEALNTLKEARQAYTREEQKALTQAAELAVCHEFSQRTDVATIAGLKSQLESHKADLTGWPFYAACRESMTNMGIPVKTAELYLQSCLENMGDNFFADRAQQAIQGAEPYDEMFRLAESRLDELQEHPESTLSFNRHTGAMVSIPLKAGVADITAHLEVAQQNGISVWKGDDGKFHMTLMQGAKLGLGIEAEVGLESLISAVKVKAGAGIKGGRGCDLSFPNQSQCQMFMAAVLGGRASPELLALCSEASVVEEAGVEGNVSLSLGASVSVDEDVDIISAEVTAGVEGSAVWQRTENSGQVTHTRTLRGAVSVSASVSVGTEEMQEEAEALGEELENMAFAAEEVGGSSTAADAVKRMAPEFSVEHTFYQRAYEEERSVSTRPNGVLEDSRRVRAFVLNDPVEAHWLLRDEGVPAQTIADVSEDIARLGRGDFRIEVVRKMRPAAVDAYNAAKTGGGKPQITGNDFDVAEVRLVHTDSVERSNTLNLSVLKIQAGRSMEYNNVTRYGVGLAA